METKKAKAARLVLTLIAFCVTNVCAVCGVGKPAIAVREVDLAISVHLRDGTPVPDLALRVSNVDGSAFSRRLVQKTDRSGSATFSVPLDADTQSIMVRPIVSPQVPSVPSRDRLADRVVCESRYVIDVPLDVARLDFPIIVEPGRVISARLSLYEERAHESIDLYFSSPSSVPFPKVMLRDVYRCKYNNLILRNQTVGSTTLFVQAGSHVSVMDIPAGSSDLDLGNWYLPDVDGTPSNSVCGRLKVTGELLQEFPGIETGITFYNIDDCSIRSFWFADPRKRLKSAGGENQVYEYLICTNNSPVLRLVDPVELPPGRYVVIPGPMSAVDFQMKAIKRLNAGLDPKSFSDVFFFEVFAGQLIELGSVDYDFLVKYFKELP